MTQFLIEHFVKDYEDVEKISVRTAYGVLASIVGIFCNVFLFAVKFTIGVIAHSVSVMADAFNNLSDAGSSIISFIGVKMAEKPADRDHPFGHGRIEYIAALVVSFLILEVGFTFLKDSIGKIRTPEMLNFQIASVIILILSIGVKLWLGLFNKRLGEKINSKVMMAVFADSMGDVITTGATILSLIIFRITGWNIDGVVGIGVADKFTGHFSCPIGRMEVFGQFIYTCRMVVPAYTGGVRILSGSFCLEPLAVITGEVLVFHASAFI